MASDGLEKVCSAFIENGGLVLEEFLSQASNEFKNI